MTDNAHFDIAIVGSGIIGASLASMLTKHTSLSVALIDPVSSVQHFDEAYDPRVIALSSASQDIYEELHLWPYMRQQRVCPYADMHVWDAEGTGHIHFNCTDIHRKSLGHIVESSVIINVLHEFLQRQANITFFASAVEHVKTNEDTEVVSDITLENGQRIHASLVVAADGAHSRLREHFSFATRQWEYQHTAIVTTVKTEKSHAFTAWQCFSVDGPLAFLPLTNAQQDEHHCSIVWSLKTTVAEKMLTLDEADFCKSVGNALQHKLGMVEACEHRLHLPLQQRHSKRYIKPGLVLVGDAAHTVHPLAGQGANLGLYDVQVLAKEIGRACQRNIPLGDISILKRYERQRMPHNLLAMLTMEGFKQLFGAENIALRWLRNTGMNFFNQQPMIKNQLSRIASGKYD